MRKRKEYKTIEEIGGLESRMHSLNNMLTSPGNFRTQLPRSKRHMSIKFKPAVKDSKGRVIRRQ